MSCASTSVDPKELDPSLPHQAYAADTCRTFFSGLTYSFFPKHCQLKAEDMFTRLCCRYFMKFSYKIHTTRTFALIFFFLQGLSILPEPWAWGRNPLLPSWLAPYPQPPKFLFISYSGNFRYFLFYSVSAPVSLKFIKKITG